MYEPSLAYLVLPQKIVKRSRKMVSRLGCRDPTEVMQSLQTSPPTSEETNWSSPSATSAGDSVDSQTVLSQMIGAPEPSQPSQCIEPLRRGSRNRVPRQIPTPGTDALGRRKPPAKKKKK